jgi:hypothetical protein
MRPRRLFTALLLTLACVARPGHGRRLSVESAARSMQQT